LTYCNGIDALFREIGYSHESQKWRFFIDLSVTSLKVVLYILETNIHPFQLLTNMLENYENMKLILKLINYRQHEWRICCDLKIVELLV